MVPKCLSQKKSACDVVGLDQSSTPLGTPKRGHGFTGRGRLSLFLPEYNAIVNFLPQLEGSVFPPAERFRGKNPAQAWSRKRVAVEGASNLFKKNAPLAAPVGGVGNYIWPRGFVRWFKKNVKPVVTDPESMGGSRGKKKKDLSYIVHE